MKKRKFSVLFTLILVLSLSLFQLWPMATPVQAAAKIASVTGNWSNPATWGNSTPPVAGDTVTINTGVIVTVDTAAACTSIVINAPAANNGITISGTNTLTVSGAITMNAPSAGTITSTISVGTGTLTAGSIAIPGSATAGRFCTVSVSTGTINVTGAITFSGTAAQARLTFTGAGTLNLGGNLSAGGTFAASTGTINCNGSAAQTIGGAYTYYVLKANNTAGVTLGGASTITTLTIGDVTSNSVFNDGGRVITPGAGSVLNLTSGTYNLGSATVGTAWPAWGTRNIAAGTTVGYVSGAAQAVSITPSYSNLTFSGAGAKNPAAGTLTVGGNLTTSGGTLTINGTTNVTGTITISSGTLARGTNAITCGGLIITGTISNGNGAQVTVNGNVSGTGTITTGGTARVFNVTGNWTFNGTSTGSVSLTMNGTGAQTLSGVINTGAATNGALIINKTSGTVTLGSNITVTGSTSSAFTLTAGTFDAATYLLTATTPTLTAGTLRVGAATWAANYSFTPTPSAGFTIEYYNANPTINGAITYQNLQFSGTGTAGASATLTIQGNLTNTGGGTLNFGTNNVTLSGTVAANNIAGFTTTGTVSMTKTGGTATFTGNVNGGAFTINGTGGTLNLGSGLTHTFTGTWTRTNGTLNGGSSTLNLGGSLSGTGGTFTAGTGTVNYYAAGAQTVAGVTYNNLTLSGSGTKTLGGAVTVNGNLTIGSGATLDVSTNNYGLTVNGNWSNGSTFTPRSGLVTLSGTSAQTMSGATTFYDLTLNNSNGLNISNDETINHTLTLTAGKITTGSNTVIIGTSGTPVVRTTGYVIGNLQKYVATGSNVTQTFEVGTASAYNPVTVTFTTVSVAGNLTAKATSGDHPSIGTSWLDSSKSVNAYWSLTNSGITFNNYNAIFTFTPTDIDGGANTANFIIGKFNNPTWTYPTVGARTATSTQSTGITSFGEFAVAEARIYTLTINIVGNGGVTKNPNQATYHYNDVVQLTATANDSCTSFSNWSGDLVSTNNPDNITMTGNKTVTATFTTIPPPDCTITAPSSVYANSIGNTASVPPAGGATYTWTITNGTITAGQGTRSITWRAGTISPVTIGITVNISGCQCTNSTQVTVITPSVLAVSINGNTSFCPGTSDNLTANAAGGAPPYSYLWSTGATTQSIEVTTPGTYSVTVTDSALCSSTLVSDNNTVVTRGNGAIPRNAVLAWVHPIWWSSLTGYDFGYPNNTAQWIWESYQVVHPVEGDVVFFERSFNILSTPLDATLHVTCDNGFEAYINGNYLGWANLTDYNNIHWEDSDLTDNWVASNGWQAVQTYNIPAAMLVQGENVLTIQAANEQNTGGTVTSNPGGVVYDLIYEYRCNASNSVDVTLSPTPTANFTAVPVSGPAPLTVQFTDTSIGATSWAWDFESNGSIDSYAQNPLHQYSSPGSYTVTLIVTNTYGCSADEIKTNYINVSEPPTAPTVNSIEIYATPDCLEPHVTAMDPLTTYYAKVSISTNNEQLNQLQTVRATLFYNETGSDNMTAPGTGNTQTCAILTCTVGISPTWSSDFGSPVPSPTTTWHLGSCTQPADLNTTTGSWIFGFTPGKVATESTSPAHWDAQGKATDKSSHSGELYVRNKDINWYGEIAVNTPSVDWGPVPLGLRFEDEPNPKNVSVKYIANGNYYEDIESSATWQNPAPPAPPADTVALSTGDPPTSAGEFALMANDINEPSSAIDVTVGYSHINASRGLTAEGGVIITDYTLWLSLSASGILPVTYSGDIHYQIAVR